MTRFQQRRKKLARRGVCTRCGTARAEDGRKWCPACLAVESDKRDLRTGAEEKRRARTEARRDRIAAAMERLQRRFTVTL
jgi:hypothetical protein